MFVVILTVAESMRHNISPQLFSNTLTKAAEQLFHRRATSRHVTSRRVGIEKGKQKKKSSIRVLRPAALTGEAAERV